MAHPVFPLPEITYPLAIDTIGMTLATGHEILAYCGHRDCRHVARLNLVMLARRLGMDHSTMADVLAPKLACAACREAGRTGGKITLRLHAPTSASSEWPKERQDARARALGRR